MNDTQSHETAADESMRSTPSNAPDTFDSLVILAVFLFAVFFAAALLLIAVPDAVDAAARAAFGAEGSSAPAQSQVTFPVFYPMRVRTEAEDSPALVASFD
jgi:hypothetical protein